MANLHNLIATHRVKKIAEYIDAHIGEVGTADENGFYPLQIAAREGLLQVVLSLLAAGTPLNQIQEDDGFNGQTYQSALNLAIEYEHFHIARVLIACSANMSFGYRSHLSDAVLEKLNVSVELVGSLIYYFINQSSRASLFPLINHLRVSGSSRKVDIIGGLIEFALLKKEVEIARRLMEISPPRQDVNIPNAAYWAVQKNSEEVATEFCPGDQDRLLMLMHLKRFSVHSNHKQFSVIFDKESGTIKNKFKQIKSLFAPIEEIDLIMEAAVTHDADSLSIYCNNVDEYLLNFQSVFLKNNYVALNALMEFKKFDSLDEMLLLPYPSDLLEFCIINFSGNIATKIIELLDERSSHTDFLKLLDTQWSRQGFYYTLTSQGVQMHMRPDKKTLAVLKYLKKMNREGLSQLDTLKLAILNTHGFEIPEQLERIANTKTPTYKIHANYGLQTNRRLTVLFNRFENALVVNSLSKLSPLEGLPDDVTLHVMSYLHSDDKRRNARRLSFMMYNVMLKDITSNTALTNEKIYQLQDQMEILENFRELILQETKNYNRKYFAIALSINLALCGITIWLSDVAYPMGSREQSVMHKLFYTKFNGTTCGEQSHSHDPCDNYSRAIEFCRELCDDLPPALEEGLYLAGAIIFLNLAVLGILMSLIFYQYQYGFLRSEKVRRMANRGFGTDEHPVPFDWVNDQHTNILQSCQTHFDNLKRELKENYPKAHEEQFSGESKPSSLTIQIEEIADEKEADEKTSLIEARTESPDSQAVVPVARLYQNYSGAFWKVTDEASKDLLEPLLDQSEKKSDEDEKNTSLSLSSRFG